MRIGAHVDSTDPLAEAAAREADAVQFFLSDPQGWKAPAPREDAERLRDAETEIYVHAPYVINVATLNNRIRIPSRKLLLSHATAAATVGAKGLIVHGGHVNAGDDLAVGFDNWRKTFAYAAESGGFAVPVLIENTAGGDNACARRLDALARLWDAVGSSRWASAWTPATPTPAVRNCSASSTGSRRSPVASTWCTPTTPRGVRLRAGPARQPRRRHDRPRAGGGRDPGGRRAGHRGDAGRRDGSGRRHRLPS